MVPLNFTPAPSTPVPFVSAYRLWRRGLKWSNASRHHGAGIVALGDLRSWKA